MMEQLTLALPDMWADHHVIVVRGILAQVDGVTITTASALEQSVSLEFDATRTDAQRIVEALRAGGYPTGSREHEAPPTDKPAWATAGVRVTTTDPDDISMSGDHRQY
jgi:copper chaperone CopZ